MRNAQIRLIDHADCYSETTTPPGGLRYIAATNGKIFNIINLGCFNEFSDRLIKLLSTCQCENRANSHSTLVR